MTDDGASGFAEAPYINLSKFYKIKYIIEFATGSFKLNHRKVQQ